MTQEIGFVEPFDRTQQIDFEKFPIGGTLELVQYHSCDTAARFQVGNKELLCFLHCMQCTEIFDEKN